MKVLVICSGNYVDVEKDFALKRPFISDQVQALVNLGISIEIFFIKGKGLMGYLKNILILRKKILNNEYDLIHAHYGFSGLISCMGSLFLKTPVLTTFHGSDITNNRNFVISILPILFSTHVIFVSDKLKNKSKRFLFKTNYSVIPCGVNLNLFYPRDRKECCEKLKLSTSNTRILFSSAFNNPIKNFPLALAGVRGLKEKVEFLEIKNRSRSDVALLLNASDALILTSFTEGSPQIIKEAMASNCPIVSTDVGDVKNIICATKECFLIHPNEKDLSAKLEIILSSRNRSNGRDFISEFNNEIIANKIRKIYSSII